jgi:type III pantothenate kinase
MLITVDIGNSHVNFGGFEGDVLQFVASIATDERKTGEQYACEMKSVIALHGMEHKKITGVVISSVVPGLLPILERALAFLTDAPVLNIGSGVRTGINIKLEQPRNLGTDLVANAVWAAENVKMPCVIVDFGTATTFTVLNRYGALVGKVIAPGVQISMEALGEKAAQLPLISLEKPREVLGRNTVDAMCSGAVYGGAAMADGLLLRIAETLNETPTIILTGGKAELIGSCMKTAFRYVPYTTLQGLRILWEKNRG